MTHNTVIIVAGGSGNRMQSIIPKQFLLLKGLPVIMHSINAFLQYQKDIELIVVLPEDHLHEWKELCKAHGFSHPHKLVAGGNTRFDSVNNALQKVTGEGFVAIHDAVRPLVSQKTIATAFKKAAEAGNAVPCVTLSDSVRLMENEISKPLERSRLRAVQTPQVFDKKIIKNAYASAPHDCFTDDATVVEESGVTINLTEGNVENLKLTHPVDLKLAEILIS